MKDHLVPGGATLQDGSQEIRPDKSEVRFINNVVSFVLAAGMYSTVGFYLVGLVLLFLKGDSIPEISKQYFHSFGSFTSEILSLQPRPFLFIGTVSLILTPVGRVVVSIFAFWKEKDKKFVLVTILVFLIIFASVLVGSVFKISVG